MHWVFSLTGSLPQLKHEWGRVQREDVQSKILKSAFFTSGGNAIFTMSFIFGEMEHKDMFDSSNCHEGLISRSTSITCSYSLTLGELISFAES